MQLYNYFRSSASYRVRIALALKGLDYDYLPVHLQKNEQLQESYAALSPARLVPLLKDGDSYLHQSLAIIEYLDETHPEPPLLPKEPLARARVRALALAIACDIHPINNTRVLGYLEKQLGLDQASRDAWARHWIDTGFRAIETTLAGSKETGKFCHGERPGLADICLVPQVANAGRVNLDMSPYPTINRIVGACNDLPPFKAAAPRNQPDAEP